MEIDKKTIKALSSDTRVEILKALKQRRKLPSELSRELNIASSTVVEHLKKLESAELVKKQKRGAKWVYYDLTKKGSDVIRPKITTQFVLILSIGLIMIIGGAFNLASTVSTPVYGEVSKTISHIVQSESVVSTATAGAEIANDTAQEIVNETIIETQLVGHVLEYEINWLALIMLIVGVFIISYALWKRRKPWK